MEILECFQTFLLKVKFWHWLVLSSVAALPYVWRYVKSQWRFGKNLKRKIYFLKTSDNKNLQTQKDRLKELGLFNLEEDIKDISKSLDVLQNLKDNAIYIASYSNKYEYKKLFNEVKNKKIPIIIFAHQEEIKKSDWDLMNNYIYCDVANTTNRLAIILLNTLKIR